MESPAFKSLGAVERATFLMIYNRHNGGNNGQIPLSIREVALELDIGKTRAAKAFDELQRAGFVRVGLKSSFDWKVELSGFEGRSTRWRLTEEPSGPPEKRTPATKEFAAWRSPRDDYVGHLQERVAKAKAKKIQNAVRPQVRGVPTSGQGVPTSGQSAIEGVLSVPVGGHRGQKAQLSVPEDGQYISTIHSASQ